MKKLYKDLGIANANIFAIYEKTKNVITYNTTSAEGANLIVVVS